MNTCNLLRKGLQKRDSSHSTPKFPMIWISWTWTQIWALADSLIHLILGCWWFNYLEQGCTLKHSYLSTRSLYNFYDWYSSCLPCISLVDEICGCPPYLTNYSFLSLFFFFSNVTIRFRPLCGKILFPAIVLCSYNNYKKGRM